MRVTSWTAAELLQRSLEKAMIDLSGATDSRGLRIMLTCAPTTWCLGIRLRELAAMTEHEFVTEGVSQEHALATLSRNCLLVAKAFDAAAQYERCLAGQPGERVSASVDESGVVFGCARFHD